MAGLSFSMPNLHSFPMQKLCYDLKLEVLEQMDPMDMIKLMRGDAEFRSILSTKPGIFFGEHVYSIFFQPGQIVEIQKYPESLPICLDLRAESALLNRIRSCVIFNFIEATNDARNNLKKEIRWKFLATLNAIGEVTCLGDYNSFREYFSFFKGKVTKRIFLNLDWYTWNGEDERYREIPNLFQNQLVNCKEILVEGRGEQFDFFCKSFMMTNVQAIQFNIKEKRNRQMVADIVARRIIQRGIPSQNRYPAILIKCDGSNLFTTSFKDVPASKTTDGWSDNALKCVNEILPMYSILKCFGRDCSHQYYKTRVDDERDCIYIVTTNEVWSHFFAKYVPAQPENECHESLAITTQA